MKRDCIKRISIAALCFVLIFSSALAEYATLRSGASGDDVFRMQTALYSLGYSITPDGKYGSGTTAVVKKFQQDNNLQADGIAGNATLTVLYSKIYATAQPTAVTYKTATVKTSGASLNMRSSPASNASVIAKLPNGTTVTVYSTVSTWSLIEYNGKTGYVASSYLTYTAAPQTAAPVITATPAPTATATAAQSAVINTSGSKLNMRSGPSTSYSITTTVPNYATVSVLQKGSSWSLISYQGYTGYVSSSYLRFITGTVAATPTKTPVITATPVPTATPAPVCTDAKIKTAGSALNMRSGPAATYSVICCIPNGTAVTVLSRGSSWSMISWQNYTGYVSNTYLVFTSATATPTQRITAAPTQPVTAVPTSTPIQSPVYALSATVKTTGGTLNMRSYASTSASVIYKLPNLAIVEVVSKGSSWSTVRYNGYTGYVSNAYLVFSQQTATVAPAVTPAPTAPPTATPAIQAIGFATVNSNASSLNLRESASSSAKIITQIPKGSTINVYTYSSSWSYVSYNGKYGYVMSGYISYTPYASNTATPGPTVKPTATPVPYNTDIFSRTLRSGYTGNDVKQLQTRLNELNYLAASSVNGTYDSATVSAVRTFQTTNGLTSDGVAGPATFTALFSSSAVPYSASLSSYSTLHIYYRNADSQDTTAIRKMQNALKDLGYTVTVNGSFDETTYVAVLQFQLRNNLTVTGAVSPAMQVLLYSGKANGMSSTPSVSVAQGEGIIAGPDVSEVQLLHWFNVVKPSLASNAQLLIFDPITHLSWTLQVYSKGNHCDSQPLTLKDTLIMNKAFGKPSWTVHTVYVLLPDGRWTMATMHNRPHLTGSITANGLDGHLCVHFLRDIDEVTKNDPDYGLTNQNTLRKSWQTLTGEKVN